MSEEDDEDAEVEVELEVEEESEKESSVTSDTFGFPTSVSNSEDFVIQKKRG